MSKRIAWIGLILFALVLSLTACMTRGPRPLTNRPTNTPAAPTSTPTPRPVYTPKRAAPPAQERGRSAGAAAWFAAACHLCHGQRAEGGVGPALAHTQLDVTMFVDRVRNAAPPMPSFSAAQVDDATLMTIYAWLQNPTLEQVATPTPRPDLSAGARLWQSKDCAVCHGAFGQGGKGPQLAGIDLSVEEFLQRVRQGSDQMPVHSADLVSDDEVQRIYEWLVHDATTEGGC